MGEMTSNTWSKQYEMLRIRAQYRPGANGFLGDPKVIALCDEVEALEKENALLADAYDIKSVPCSKCGAETGSLGRRITYLIAQNEAFREQLRDRLELK